MTCLKCGQPATELKCPACGFDLSQAGQVASLAPVHPQIRPPDPMPVPGPDDVEGDPELLEACFLGKLAGLRWKLKEVTFLRIPKSVRRIDKENSFEKYLPQSVQVLLIHAQVDDDGSSFRLEDGLKRIWVEPGHPTLASMDGVLFSADYKRLIHYPAEKPEENYAVPEGVTEICSDAFSFCKRLKNISLPLSLQRERNLFFRDGPATCPSFHSFQYIEGLRSITVHEENPHLCAEQGILFSKDKTTLYGFPRAKFCARYTIPPTVKRIDSHAFEGCSKLKEITIPASVTKIGKWAFQSCSSLNSITIADSVTTIDYETFWNCRNLKSVTIPDSVTKIVGNYPRTGAFYGCPSLLEVSVAENCIVEPYAFDEHTKVTRRGAPRETGPNRSEKQPEKERTLFEKQRHQWRKQEARKRRKNP